MGDFQSMIRVCDLQEMNGSDAKWTNTYEMKWIGWTCWNEYVQQTASFKGEHAWFPVTFLLEKLAMISQFRQDCDFLGGWKGLEPNKGCLMTCKTWGYDQEKWMIALNGDWIGLTKHQDDLMTRKSSHLGVHHPTHVVKDRVIGPQYSTYGA